MDVVSVRLYYFLVSPKIIWLPWQRPLLNQKIRCRSIICTQSALIRWKDSKIGPVHPEIFDKICRTTTQFLSVSLFSAETTGPIFIKILHDIVALVALLNYAYTRRYPIPFLNAKATKLRSLPFFHKIGCHGNVPWDIGKRGPDRSSAPKTLSFGEKIVKIGPADPEIIVLREIIKKKERKELRKVKYIARSAT